MKGSRRPLESYHYVWLAEHPRRTEDWLRERLADDFHIHHIDGDHSNDTPGNLVLIDGADHLFIHNGKKRPVSFVRPKKAPIAPSILRRAEQKKAANIARTHGFKSKSEARAAELQRGIERAQQRLRERNDTATQSFVTLGADG